MAARGRRGLLRVGGRWLVGLAGCLLVVGVLAAPALAAGTWVATQSMSTGRNQDTATLLENGDVLVAGGFGSSGPLASAELYDPSTGQRIVTGPMGNARANQTATYLGNGEVLVAGGEGSSTSSAELYDPASGTWTATGSLNAGRELQTATLLQNGKVLVAGGQGSSGTMASAELYDPSTGQWTVTGPMGNARANQTATLLGNGRCWSPAANRPAWRWRARSCMTPRRGCGPRPGR